MMLIPEITKEESRQFVDVVRAGMTVEERLEGLKPEELLAGLKPEGFRTSSEGFFEISKSHQPNSVCVRKAGNTRLTS